MREFLPENRYSSMFASPAPTNDDTAEKKSHTCSHHPKTRWDPDHSATVLWTSPIHADCTESLASGTDFERTPSSTGSCTTSQEWTISSMISRPSRDLIRGPIFEESQTG